MKKIILTIFLLMAIIVSFRSEVLAGCCRNYCYSSCMSSNSSVGTCSLGSYTCDGTTYRNASCEPSCSGSYQNSCPNGALCTSSSFTCSPCGNSATCYKVLYYAATPTPTPKFTAGCSTCSNGASCGSCGTGNRYCSCSGSGSSKVCTSTTNCACNGTCCTPSCAAAGSYCAGVAFSDGCGGTCYGTQGASSYWSDWSSCSNCSQSRSCVSSCGGTCSGSSTQSCGYSNGSNGSCGSANGGLFPTTPSSGLCNSGYSASPSLSGRTFYWTCSGTSGSCGGSGGSGVNCSATLNRSPILDDIKVTDDDDVTLPTTTLANGRLANHICQTTDRIVKFFVEVSDPDGSSDLASVQLKINGVVYNSESFANGMAIFKVQYPLNSTKVTSVVSVLITDIYGGTNGWVDTGHDFKIWDCNVPVSGNIYDGTEELVCPTIGFSKEIDKTILNFKSLIFVKNGVGVSMTVSSENNTYTTQSNGLTWGVDGYVPQFNSDISLTNPKMKLASSSPVSTTCGWYIDTTTVDPYTDNPSFKADFSGIVTQSPWWQANEGGVLSNKTVSNRIPITCATDNCKISINALVSSVLISNTKKDLSNSQNWYYSGSLAKLANVNTNYSYFYNQYFVKNGIGTTLIGDKNISDIGATGIYLVDGNLNIDSNKTLTAGNFLMVVVKGNITITSTVANVDGLYLAENINATGIGDKQLVINGTIFAFDTVDLSRDYSPSFRETNNTSPVVVVNYNPQLIFNLPGSVAKVLTNWQWGN